MEVPGFTWADPCPARVLGYPLAWALVWILGVIVVAETSVLAFLFS